MRKTIEWSEDLSVGIERFNDDHKKLIRMLNELFAACSIGHGSGMIFNTISKLMDYAKGHFDREEELMKTHAYPELDEHRREHQSFSERIDQFKERLEHDEMGEVSIELLDFLEEWFENHLLGVDKKYASFFNQRGIY
ncbi:MAG: bacteriohemerythrin [Pseudomonadota bacterium]